MTLFETYLKNIFLHSNVKKDYSYEMWILNMTQGDLFKHADDFAIMCGKSMVENMIDILNDRVDSKK